MCLDFISTVCCATLAGHDGHPHLGHDTDHIVPDFDDPDIPERVWDAYLRDGKITQEERERVAQHAAETGRAGKRTRDDIDTTGETQKKAKIDPDETGRKRTRDSDESSGDSVMLPRGAERRGGEVTQRSRWGQGGHAGGEAADRGAVPGQISSH